MPAEGVKQLMASSEVFPKPLLLPTELLHKESSLAIRTTFLRSSWTNGVDYGAKQNTQTTRCYGIKQRDAPLER